MNICVAWNPTAWAVIRKRIVTGVPCKKKLVATQLTQVITFFLSIDTLAYYFKTWFVWMYLFWTLHIRWKWEFTKFFKRCKSKEESILLTKSKVKLQWLALVFQRPPRKWLVYPAKFAPLPYLSWFSPH